MRWRWVLIECKENAYKKLFYLKINLVYPLKKSLLIYFMNKITLSLLSVLAVIHSNKFHIFIIDIGEPNKRYTRRRTF